MADSNRRQGKSHVGENQELAMYAFCFFPRFLSRSVTDTRRQPSDSRGIFAKYCIVGWGLPVVVVALCSVVDLTGTFRFGYGL